MELSLSNFLQVIDELDGFLLAFFYVESTGLRDKIYFSTGFLHDGDG